MVGIDKGVYNWKGGLRAKDSITLGMAHTDAAKPKDAKEKELPGAVVMPHYSNSRAASSAMGLARAVGGGWWRAESESRLLIIFGDNDNTIWMD
jgi:hypothetical protein